MRTSSFRKAALLALATICAAGFTACENNDNPGDDEKEYTLYLQRSYDGVNWSGSAKCTVKATL